MPEAAALVDMELGQTWNWRQLQNATRFVSENLLGGLPPGGVVILHAENEPAFVVAFLGILRAGLSAFCISPASATAEMQAMALAGGAVAAIGAVGVAPLSIPMDLIRQARDETPSRATVENRNIDQAALLLQSSGTTGTPKIVCRRGPSLDLVTEAMCAAIGFGPSDHVLAAAPLCHSYGLEHGLLAPVWAGSGTHFCRRFDVQTFQSEKCRAITIFPGVPFMFEAMAQSGMTLPNLRRAYSAGGLLPAVVSQNFALRFGVTVGQVYGTTEIGSVTFNDPDARGFAPNSVGRPMRDVSIHIDSETSQVEVAAPWMFEGYLNEYDGIQGGRFLTGDLGQLDSHGNLFITGRLKLVIDIGGRKVNPLEVESVLADHSEVAQCVVIPMALAGTVTRLKALVVPRNRSAPPSPADLRRFVKDRLASYKVPRVFEVRERLPQSSTGKILRHLIEG